MEPRLLAQVAFMALVAPLAAQNESVKPGINANYLNPELQVTEWVERFETEGREVFDHRQKIVDEVGIESGMAVADIGTGTGLFLPLFAEKVGPGGRVYAVDIVAKFLEHIDARIADNDWNAVETVLCTERSVELPTGSIDVAFICDVYHHFEYPPESLASIHAALKPGGRLFLVEFKRIPGESSDWMLDHVRAGQEVFTAEITAAGFDKISEVKDLLSDNYVLKFRKR